MQREQVQVLLSAAFSELEQRTLLRFGAGWDNEAWLVNETYLFRFPLHAEAARFAQMELQLLPALAPTLPVAVPDFPYRAPAGALDFPWPFGGYPLLPGEQLAAHAALRSDPGVRERLGTRLGEFLTALHAFPVVRAQELGVPGGTIEAWRAHLGAWWAEMRTGVTPHLTPAEAEATTNVVEGFLQKDRHFAFTPVLTHHDLSEDHLLVDPLTGSLTAIIDFGDARIADPAFDFTGIMHLGPGALAQYRGPRDSGFAERTRFYRWLSPLHTLRHGLEIGDAGQIEQGRQALRNGLHGWA